MILSIILLIIGFLLLVKGADFFVEGASDIARKLGIPSIVIGLTIVALGTSLPELAVSVTAALKGSNDIALGNVTGSNIMNLLVVVGLAAVIRPMAVKRSVLRRDYVMMFLMILLMLGTAAESFWNSGNGEISRLDGAVLLGVTAGYMCRLIRTAVRDRVAEQFGITRPLPVSLLFCAGGAAAIIGGGQMVVNSVVAARKGESEIALGNVLGSNILNIGFILGTSGVIHPIGVGMENVCDIVILTALTAVFFIPLWQKEQVSRITGIFMMGCYLGYMAYIIVR